MVLARWNNSPWIDMSPHSWHIILIPSQPVFAFLLNAACLAQKQQIPILNRLTATRDKVYQLLAHGRWFSRGTPASSITKTGRHDIAESGIKHNNQINQFYSLWSDPMGAYDLPNSRPAR